MWVSGWVVYCLCVRHVLYVYGCEYLCMYVRVIDSVCVYVCSCMSYCACLHICNIILQPTAAIVLKKILPVQTSVSILLPNLSSSSTLSSLWIGFSKVLLIYHLVLCILDRIVGAWRSISNPNYGLP